MVGVREVEEVYGIKSDSVYLFEIRNELKKLNNNLIKFLDFYASEHGWSKT